MATKLYFHNALSGLSNLPTTRNSDAPGTLITSIDNQNINRTMDRNVGTSWTFKTTTTVNSTLTQEFYWTKFVSPPLTAQTISANTWTYHLAFYESNTSANFPRSGMGAIYTCCYLWRPGTGLIGYIVNGNSNTDAVEPNTIFSYMSNTITFSGASQTAQDGDVIVFEISTSHTQSSATTFEIRFSYDGTQIFGTPNTDTGGNIAAYLETPQDLVFQGEGPIEMDVTDTITLTNKFITKV